MGIGHLWKGLEASYKIPGSPQGRSLLHSCWCWQGSGSTSSTSSRSSSRSMGCWMDLGRMVWLVRGITRLGCPWPPPPSPATSQPLTLTSPSSRAWESQAEVDTRGQGRVPPQSSVSLFLNRQKESHGDPGTGRENLAPEPSLMGPGENP